MNQFGVMMSMHTSMKVGGPAAAYIEPDDEGELRQKVCAFNRSGMPYFILGNGTNVIFSDDGYPGAVISTLKALNGIEIREETKIVCGAGESLARVCRFAAENGLSGLENISGIPGTIGGAVFMNAGAYDRDISCSVKSVRAFDPVTASNIMLSGTECEFGYRTSLFRTKALIILSAEFELKREDRDKIEAEMAEYQQKRNEKQPVDLPSSGSFFKRPKGDYAGRLIEEAGLKGLKVGGAQVSEKHAGFIVNTGDATASDVLELAKQIKTKVFEKFEIELKEEPVIIVF